MGPVIGMALGLGVVALLAYLAYFAMDHFAVEAGAKPDQQQSPRVFTPPAAAPTARVVQPDRPAPELKGQLIIEADALFREARRLYTDAVRAQNAGRKKEHDSLVEECRLQLKRVDRCFFLHHSWLEEAKAKGWLIPDNYETLRKRTERYARLKASLPPADH